MKKIIIAIKNIAENIIFNGVIIIIFFSNEKFP